MSIIYENILDNKTLIYYIIILFGITYSFSKQNINLGIIFGFVLGLMIINFLYKDYKQKQDNENKIKSFQESLLLPKNKNTNDKLTAFLFSIQDFYIYNPQAYKEMIDSQNNFFRIYNETLNNPSRAGINHALMNQQKKDSMNALHSIIYNIPTDKDYTEKLENAILIMESMMQKYMDKIENLHKEYIYENGYNVKTKLINKTGIEGHNYFENVFDFF